MLIGVVMAAGAYASLGSFGSVGLPNADGALFGGLLIGVASYLLGPTRRICFSKQREEVSVQHGGLFSERNRVWSFGEIEGVFAKGRRSKGVHDIYDLAIRTNGGDRYLATIWGSSEDELCRALEAAVGPGLALTDRRAD